MLFDVGGRVELARPTGAANALALILIDELKQIEMHSHYFYQPRKDE